MCLFQIDPSLYLRIIKKRGSPYDGIILWSNGDIDDEIFERAVSVVSFLLQQTSRVKIIKVRSSK